MEPERWRRIEELYYAALARGPSERSAYVAEACSEDGDLRRQIELLLARAETDGALLEKPALKVAAQELARDLDQTSTLKNHGLLGQSVSHYQVIEALGSGGMGIVYKAKDTQLGRFVALKFVPDSLSRDPQALERLKREARAASSLDHPNICTIYEIGEYRSEPFIAMQYLEGNTVRELIGGKPLDSETVLDIAIQMADAL